MPLSSKKIILPVSEEDYFFFLWSVFFLVGITAIDRAALAARAMQGCRRAAAFAVAEAPKTLVIGGPGFPIPRWCKKERGEISLSPLLLFSFFVLRIVSSILYIFFLPSSSLFSFSPPRKLTRAPRNLALRGCSRVV